MSGAFGPWVGRVEEAQDIVTARQARQLAATLDVSGPFADGDPLPAVCGRGNTVRRDGRHIDGRARRAG